MRRLRAALGFTLIELSVVLTIIALLLTLSAPRYFRHIEKTKESVLRSNLSVTRDALDKFFADTGRYPATLEELVQKRYLAKLPYDPVMESTSSWILDAPNNADGAVADLHSAAQGKTSTGLPYGEI